MKAIYFFLAAILISYNNSNAEKTATPEIKIEILSGDGIVGDWSLQLEAYDTNHNHLLDDAERTKAIANHYFYRFSADGSCLISPFATKQVQNAFKGHYVTTEKNGKKIITTYWDEAEQKGQKESQYTIISLTKDELVFLETTGDHTFWIFKRVG